MPTEFTNSRTDIATAKCPSVDWAALSTAERIRSIELEGYVVFPDLLAPPQVERVRAELDRLPTTAVDYSEHQRGCSNVQWTDSPNAIGVIALPAMVEFLERTRAIRDPGIPGTTFRLLRSARE